MPENVFVLDIGTRTVMALLASLADGNLSVSHLLYKEHKTRSMLDGQIHDVGQVAKIIAELVEEIRVASGQELKQVAVAAAGRSLKTVKGNAKIKHPASTAISKGDLLALELQAVQEAQQALPKGLTSTPLSQQYYCVGYSIVEERLDGIRLGSIVGQKGQEAEVDVVATFLPRIVVDSLQSAVESVGLELVSITLEPIAVANLVLNPTMRRLNLVLVDIGAGTSDIAVCGGNTVSAFGMVPMAGDEITESLSDHYLLDFNKAEEVKRQVEILAEVATTDVLGFEQNLPSQEIKGILDPAVDTLAAAIAKEIFELNGKPPQAVLLVGGGSLTPDLPAKLAKILSIPENRVAVQQAGKLQNILNLPQDYAGPNFITVLGIAYTALNSPTLGFITVNVNDTPVRLLNLAQNYVAEALLAGGYNIREVMGRPGLALTCEINGQLYTIPGKAGTKGSITLNGKKAELKDKVKEGDLIIFHPGEPGEEAQGTFRQILQELIGNCTVNGQIVDLNPSIKVGSTTIALDDPIRDGCKAQVITNLSIGQVLENLGIMTGSQTITVNKKIISLAERSVLRKNGVPVSLKDTIAPGDLILCEPPQNLTVADFLPKEEPPSLEIYINGHHTLLNRSLIWVNKVAAERITVVKAGDSIEYKPGKNNYQPILVDIFNEIKFSPNPPAGKNKLLIQVNGEEKEYTSLLQEGDKIELNWI